MTRQRRTFLFASALLVLATVAGAAPAPDASVVPAKPALCKADLTLAQQVPSELLGVPAPKPRTCQQDCWNFRKSCIAGCNGDEECKQTCHDQYEYCMCGGCGYCP